MHKQHHNNNDTGDLKKKKEKADKKKKYNNTWLRWTYLTKTFEMTHKDKEESNNQTLVQEQTPTNLEQKTKYTIIIHKKGKQTKFICQIDSGQPITIP